MHYRSLAFPKISAWLLVAAAALTTEGCSYENTPKSVQADIKGKTVAVPDKWNNAPGGPADAATKPAGTTGDAAAGTAAVSNANTAAAGSAANSAAAPADAEDEEERPATPLRAQADRANFAAWWRRFNDPILEQLILAALDHNPDLRSALQRVVEARAARSSAYGDMMPNIGAYANAGQNYYRLHTTKPEQGRWGLQNGAGTGANAHRQQHGDAYSAGVSATWEVDIFGKYRAAAASASALLQATEEDFRLIQLSLVATLAETYVQLRSDEALKRILENVITSRSETLRLAKWRREAGTGDDFDLQQSENEYEQARAALPVVIESIGHSKNLLSTLSGKPPGFFDPVIDRKVAPASTITANTNATGGTTGDAAAKPEPAAPPPPPRPANDPIVPPPAQANPALAAIAGVPVAPADFELLLPAKVLNQRPDVSRAKRELLSAAFLTKSARRKHYPTLNLSGAIGVEALKAGHLFRPEATVGSVLAGLALPLFNGFKISSEIEMREAQQRQALRGYESTVLAALLEVEDCFVAVKQSTGRLEVLKRSAAVAADNEKIALLRYRSGTYDLGHVLDTQRVRLAAEQQAVASATEQTLAQIRLYLALGGPAFGDTAPEPNPQPERPETIALATPAAK